MKKVKLDKVAGFLDKYFDVKNFPDYGGARNGLQFENSGGVCKVAAAVDAGLAEIEQAAEMGADLLIVHHGLFWNAPIPFVGSNYRKVKALIDSDMAVYSVHLPLDAHPRIGNNALIAKALSLDTLGRCFSHEGRDIAVLASPPPGGRAELQRRLKKLFPDTFKAIAFGPDKPKKIAICSGSCGEAVPQLNEFGIDTLICGELRQQHYVMAQEMQLNLYPCGHWATERFGIDALGGVLAKKFALKYSFIPSANPL